MKQSHKSGWKKMQKWVSLTLLLAGLLLLIVGIAVDVFPVIGAGRQILYRKCKMLMERF